MKPNQHINYRVMFQSKKKTEPEFRTFSSKWQHYVTGVLSQGLSRPHFPSVCVHYVREAGLTDGLGSKLTTSRE